MIDGFAYTRFVGRRAPYRSLRDVKPELFPARRLADIGVDPEPCSNSCIMTPG